MIFKNEKREKGKIKFFVNEKGWGIIIRDGAGEVFFHHSGLEFDIKEVREGLAVEFTPSENAKGPIAIQIKKLEEKI